MSNFNNQYNERNTHCWGCRRHLNSKDHEICPLCGWIICPDCGACKQHCNHEKIRKLEKRGFDINGLHKNGTQYDDNGADCTGRHKDYDFYVGKRVVYPSLYGKGTIKDCYFKEGFLRVTVMFDNKKSICDLVIDTALQKEIIKYTDD